MFIGAYLLGALAKQRIEELVRNAERHRLIKALRRRATPVDTSSGTMRETDQPGQPTRAAPSDETLGVQHTNLG
jgi:hypothetical protein